jgi:DNA repair exonuclease SbcCD ATPase subunit
MVGRFLPNRRKGPGGSDRFAYACSIYNAHGKKCYHNLIEEDALLRAMAEKIRQKLPPLLDELRQEIRRQVEDESKRDASTASQARKQVERLTAKVETAARRLATEDERHLPCIRKELDRLHAQLEQAEKELKAATRLPVNLEEAEEHVCDSLAFVNRLDDVLAEKDVFQVRGILTALLDKVELYFDHEQKGRYTFCTFVRALLFFKDEFLSVTEDSTPTDHAFFTGL